MDSSGIVSVWKRFVAVRSPPSAVHCRGTQEHRNFSGAYRAIPHNCYKNPSEHGLARMDPSRAQSEGQTILWMCLYALCRIHVKCCRMEFENRSSGTMANKTIWLMMRKTSLQSSRLESGLVLIICISLALLGGWSIGFAIGNIVIASICSEDCLVDVSNLYIWKATCQSSRLESGLDIALPLLSGLSIGVAIRIVVASSIWSEDWFVDVSNLCTCWVVCLICELLVLVWFRPRLEPGW